MYGPFSRTQSWRRCSFVFFCQCVFFILFFMLLLDHFHYHRHQHTVDPTHEVFPFGFSTGLSSLHAHLFNQHIEEWVASCDKFNIPITAEAGWGPVANHHASGGQGSTSTPSNDRPPGICEYSHEAFVDTITEFIIANDQVCILSSSSLGLNRLQNCSL